MEWTGLFACDWCGWMPWNCTCAQWRAAQSDIGARQPAERAALAGSVSASRTDTSPRILSRPPQWQPGLIKGPVRARTA
jgi:hypothetical protein